MNHFLLKIKRGVTDFLSFIADERCFACGWDRGFICQDCHKKVSYNKKFCLYCAYPLDYDSEISVCGNCLEDKPVFSKTIAPLIYDGLVRDIMLSAKFGGKYYLYKMLTDYIWEDLKELIKPLSEGEVIVPIPLSRRRLIERGYNQAGIIADILSRKLKKPTIHRTLLKIKDTKPQSQLGEKDRYLNIKNAFFLKKPINFSKIILVDDIITTSATITEATKVLKKGGANVVYVFSLSRATF